MGDPLFDFAGRTALVTGAASGLGRELALALAARGAFVALADARAAEETLSELEKVGGRGFTITVDVSQECSVASMAETAAQRLGKIDTLVNCAGITQHADSPSELLTANEWDRVMGVNLRGTFLCCREVGGRMIGDGGGSIVNIASSAAHKAIPRVAAYSASKAGVVALTKTLAVEWARHNVRVNAISPHYLNTPLTSTLNADAKVKEVLERQIPMRRFGHTTEVVGALLLLAGAAGSYMTGSVIEVNGGVTA